ncbi:DUF1704 domain-containing protein [Candidatus Roizmanbacteria bacterium]|nr:DUF1704 domain-containing protein [Candidatus Roizmanbacteria bacterium]
MKRRITKFKKSELLIFAADLTRLLSQVQIDPSLLTPINYRCEQRKFFASSTYNPQFTYRDSTTQSVTTILASLWRRLINPHLPLDLETYIESLIYHLALLHRAKLAIGTPLFSRFTEELYNLTALSAQKYTDCLPMVTFADTQGARMYNAYEIQDYAERYIASQEHLRYFSTYIDHHSSFTIKAGMEKLHIGSRVRRNEQNVVRLMVHEIESHLVQRQNSRRGGPLYLLRTQPARELYAEGMAVYNEVTTGTITESAYCMYFYRLKAVSMMDKSFREIYTYLSRYLSKNKAFITAFRVKRGISDTSKPGGYPKDALYLIGYKKVSDYLLSGGNVDLLYKTQVPELGELLNKYNLLSSTPCQMPPFLGRA